MKIFIPGEPIAQPRVKVSTKGGFARAYTERDHPIHAYKQAIRLAYVNAGGEVLEGPGIDSGCLFVRPTQEPQQKATAIHRAKDHKARPRQYWKSDPRCLERNRLQ
jgi:hypothetical protein